MDFQFEDRVVYKGQEHIKSLTLSMKQYVFCISLCCILLAHFTALNIHVSATSNTSCDFPAIFNFGDGNSDTGALSSVLYGTPALFGQSFFGGPAGRYSDGRLLIDFLVSSLGKPLLHSYLDSLGADFSHGANFAAAFATIAPPKSILPVVPPLRGFNPIFLDIQVSQFAQFINRSQALRQQGGLFKKLMPKREYFSKALYTIDIGQNEISQGLFGNMTVDEIKAIVPDLINRFSLNVKNIYNLGGRSFWIHNTGPIGCLPYVLTMAPVSDDQLDSVGCAKTYNELCQYFNSMLKKGVDQLRKDLPLAAFTYVDIYSAKYLLYQQPEKYGFKLPLLACCGNGGKYNFKENSLCGFTFTVNGTQVTVTPCERPSEFINWDGVTYTQQADRITFDNISSGKFSVPPNSLKLACQKV